MNSAGGRTVRVQPRTQVVVPTVACVTAGLSAPGVRAGSGTDVCAIADQVSNTLAHAMAVNLMFVSRSFIMPAMRAAGSCEQEGPDETIRGKVIPG